MSALTLDSAWAKFSRAEAHIEALKREFLAWSNRRPYRLVRQANADFTRHSQVVRVIKPPDLIRWSLIASDAIHNLRCALDHAVYAIAVHQANTDPPPEDAVLAFPICDSPEIFNKSKWRIKTLSKSVRTEIENIQPYNRPHKELPPVLGLLRTFNDSDKHRLLHVAIAHMTGGEIRGLSYPLEPQETIKVAIHTAEVVDGTEIVAVTLNRPTPDLKYKFAADIVITMRHAKGPLGTVQSEVGALFREITPEVRIAIEHLAKIA